MSDIYVQRRDDQKYFAIQNKQVIARGSVQEQAAVRAHTKKPDDPILAERVRDTKRGVRDKWRRMY